MPLPGGPWLARWMSSVDRRSSCRPSRAASRPPASRKSRRASPSRPYALTEDAIRSVGVVLVLAELPDGRRRVRAAHYVRPLEQDPEGHVQRRPPALLAAWDAERDRLDDYAWGITTELAGRVGREPVAFERALVGTISAARRPGPAGHRLVRRRGVGHPGRARRAAADALTATRSAGTIGFARDHGMPGSPSASGRPIPCRNRPSPRPSAPC